MLIWENLWEYESLPGFQEFKAFEWYRRCGLFHGFLKKVRKVDSDEGFVRNLNFDVGFVRTIRFFTWVLCGVGFFDVGSG